MRAAGLLRVGALALIWGSGFLLIKVSLRSFTPVELTFARLALGALILTAILLVRRLALPHQRTLWLHLLAAALLGNAIPYTLFGVAEQTVESNLAGAINATTPLWTLLFAAALRQSKRLGSTQILGIILGFVGALLILAPWRSDSAPLPGVLACLAASASYGLSYVYMGRYLTGRNLSPLVLSAGQLIAATGLLALALPFGGTLGGSRRMTRPRHSSSWASLAPVSPTSSTTASSPTTALSSPPPSPTYFPWSPSSPAWSSSTKPSQPPLSVEWRSSYLGSD